MTFHCSYFLLKDMLLSGRKVRLIKVPNERTLGTTGFDTYSKEVLTHLRGCLHAKFHPWMKLVMKLVSRRNHPCLWWNVSYCLHVPADMKFHPGMNSSLSKRQGLNFIPAWKKEPPSYFKKNLSNISITLYNC